MSDLFRKQAIEARQSRWTGDVSSIRPVKVWVPVALISVIAVVALTFLFFGSYTRKERVTGVIAPAEGIIRLRSPESAVISAILVRDGQEVRAGELLVQLSRERVGQDGPTAALVDRSLGLQADQIRLQTREQQAAASATAAGLAERMRRATRDLVHIDEELRLQQQLIAASGRVIANLKPLAEERIISDLQYQQQLNQQLDQSARLQSLMRAREALQAEARGAQTELDALKARTQADSAGAERTRLALEQDRLQRRSDSALQLHAPVDGTVTALLGSIGQRVEPVTLIAAIVPANATLQAVLYVPSSAMAQIRPGRRVTLRYDAFPFEKFGQYSGTVTKVSEADVAATDLDAPAAAAAKDRNMFRIRVKLDSEQIEAYGSTIRLRPGLTLSADIELDRRRLIEWMLDPLYALARKL
jgi:membrane fusion protein